MTDRLSIRFIKPGEEGEVCALVVRVFDSFVATELSPEGIEEFHRFAQPEALAQRRQEGGQVLVAEVDARVVGMLELKGLDHIAMLFVETPRRGIGRRLVEQALQICRQAEPGLEQVRVYSSGYAVPVYRRLGFEAEGPEQTKNGITYLPMVFRFPGGE